MRTRRTARRDKVEIYLHLMWTTWDRLPLIAPEWEANLYGVLHSVIDKNGCFLIASGGMADHVHLLVSIRSTTRTCDLIKDLKGTSARFCLDRVPEFKWRPTYAAFSVSRWDTEMIQNYLRGQKRHHSEGTTEEHWSARMRLTGLKIAKSERAT
jgi:REP element-mobilizing transposase RayT